jgi:hypothetical protein
LCNRQSLFEKQPSDQHSVRQNRLQQGPGLHDWPIRLAIDETEGASARQEHHLAKVENGRLSGLFGMGTYTVEELDALADEHLNRIDDPTNSDDPRWLHRRATRLRKLARQKEKSVEHKSNQKT